MVINVLNICISTETAAYYLLNSILTSLDKQEIVGGLFCDLQKVVDCVIYSFLGNSPASEF